MICVLRIDRCLMMMMKIDDQEEDPKPWVAIIQSTTYLAGTVMIDVSTLDLITFTISFLRFFS